MLDWLKLEQKISDSIDGQFQHKRQSSVSGGDTHHAYRIEGVVEENKQKNTVSFFVKTNHKSHLETFSAEAAGLQEIEKAQAIKVPQVICCGVEAEKSYLVLENLSLTSGTAGSAEKLAQQLAELHKYKSKNFGWSRDNTIGSTQQINTRCENWVDFWRDHRLGLQLKLAKKKGITDSFSVKGEALLKGLDKFFIDYKPQASLLHGDLWSGNYGYINKVEPVIFDPAVYYGDRETDIAMTELFGGFPEEFYRAYNETWPLDKGYQQRKNLYNLYHIINHFNLFGGGYGMQAERMIEQLLEFKSTI